MADRPDSPIPRDFARLPTKEVPETNAPARPVLVTLAACLISAASWASSLLLLAALPEILHRLGVEEAAVPYQLTVLAGAYSLGAAVSALVWGRASDSLGRRPVIALGLLGDGLMAVLMGTSASTAQAVNAALLGGATAGVGPAIAALLRDGVAQEHRTAAFSLVAFCSSAAFTLGPLLPAALLPHAVLPAGSGLEALVTAYPGLGPCLVAAAVDLFSILALVPWAYAPRSSADYVHAPEPPKAEEKQEKDEKDEKAPQKTQLPDESSHMGVIREDEEEEEEQKDEEAGGVWAEGRAAPPPLPADTADAPRRMRFRHSVGPGTAKAGAGGSGTTAGSPGSGAAAAKPGLTRSNTQPLKNKPKLQWPPPPDAEPIAGNAGDQSWRALPKRASFVSGDSNRDEEARIKNFGASPRRSPRPLPTSPGPHTAEGELLTPGGAAREAAAIAGALQARNSLTPPTGAGKAAGATGPLLPPAPMCPGSRPSAAAPSVPLKHASPRAAAPAEHTLHPLDADGDGAVSKEEMGLKHVSPAAPRPAEEQHVVTREERGLTHVSLRAAAAAPALHPLDADGDGVVSKEEMGLKRHVSMKDARQPEHTVDVVPKEERGLKHVSPRAAAVAPALHPLDADGDGVVSKEEMDLRM